MTQASVGQQRLLRLEQRDRSRSSLATACLRILGPLDAELLLEALEVLVARHESLRTTFELEDEELRRSVAPEAPVPLALLDLRFVPRVERDARLTTLAEEEPAIGFALALGPPARFTLVEFSDDEHGFLVTGHLSLFDEAAVLGLAGELLALYRELGQR